MREINLIVVHCTYSRPSMDIGVEEIRKWHVEGNSWTDIGYHYVIRRDGTIEDGRPIERPGAHVKGHNSNSIGIAWVGGWRLKLKNLKITELRRRMKRWSISLKSFSKSSQGPL